MKNEILPYILLLLIIILITSSIVFGPKKQTSGTTKNLSDLTSQIQNHTNSYKDIQNIDYVVPNSVNDNFVGVDEVKNINNEDTVITYNSNFNPNLGNVIEDLLEGFANTDDINLEGCINPDQIAINYQSKVCNAEDCYDRFGNRVGINSTIEEIVNRENIEFCSNQELGYLTFNFGINPLTNSIRSDSLFMEIENIYLGVSKYNQLNSDTNLKYYFDNNFFIEDENIDKDTMIPRIIHSRFKRNNFRQKIIVQRYTAQGVSSTAGSLAELFFRPGQMFLTAVNVNNSITTVNSLADTAEFSGNYAVRIIDQNGNKSAKCIIDNNNNVKIIDGGLNYIKAGISIEQDDGEFGGNFNITLAKKSKRLVMKLREDENDESARAVWLLTAPTNLSPQGITKQNKITKGYILDFSNQSPVSNINKAVRGLPPYSRVSPGTIISPVQFDIVSTTIGDILSANNCKDLEGDGGQIYNNCVDNLVIQGQPLSYYDNFKNLFDGQINVNNFLDLFSASLGTTASFSINNEAYSQYPSNLLRAVSKFPLFADPKNLTNNGQVSVFVFAFNPSINQKIFQVYVGVSDIASAVDNQITQDIILDGAVEWQEINTFFQTTAFRKDYFTQPSLSDGVSTIISISNINITTSTGGVSFVKPIYGKVSQLDFTNATYNNITLPNFDSSKKLKLDSSTLVVQGDGASIGTDATCLVSFIAQGTSIVIESAQVLDLGNSFQSGTFGILGSGLSVGLTGVVDGVEITSVNDEYIFEAVTTTTDNNSPISPSAIVSNLDFDITYGLIINPVQNQVLSLENPQIVEGGANYNIGLSVFINQYDLLGESVFGVEYNPENITSESMKKLPYVVVNGVSSKNFLQPSVYPLFSDTSVGISYNFWEDSPGTYSNSPQQIVFYGDFIGVSPANVIGEPSSNLSEFLTNNKLGDSAFTNAEYLQSLQIPSYYYQDEDEDFPVIEAYEGLVLKRFIPYSQFSPPEFKKGEKIPTKTPTKNYINYNYCQFIPFGIENIYNKKINSSNISTF
jgi:hypothetical protein